MPLTEKQFKEYLALYGAEIEQWPGQLRHEGQQAMHHAAADRLVIEQQYVDEVMLSHRPFEPADRDLAARIIYTARTARRQSSMSLATWLQEFIQSVFPRPAFALTAILTLGVAIGFTMPAFAPNGGDGTIVQAFLEDDGGVL